MSHGGKVLAACFPDGATMLTEGAIAPFLTFPVF
jgi:hypothetical protein